MKNNQDNYFEKYIKKQSDESRNVGSFLSGI